MYSYLLPNFRPSGTDKFSHQPFMIHFFRRIRQKLLTEGRLSKYLVYAIGEIALVMIGILLALQVNNWNEQRHEDKKEVQLLHAIKAALLSDIDQLNVKIIRANKDNKSVDIIKPYVQSLLPLHYSLALHFGIITKAGRHFKFRPQLAAYNKLKNEGADLIKNQKLQSALLDLYSIEQPLVDAALENYKNNIRSYGRPIARKKFLFSKNAEYTGIMPVDYPSIIGDVELQNVLEISHANNIQIIDQSTHLIYLSKQLIALIESELNH